MKKRGRLFLFGFASWVVIFSSSIALSPLKASYRPLFETLSGIILTSWTLVLTLRYFGEVRRSHLPEGLNLGVSFFLVNIFFDVCLYLWGPLKIPLMDYFMDIGLTYLSMPAITLTFAYAVRRARRARHQDHASASASRQEEDDDEDQNFIVTSSGERITRILR